MDRPVIPGGQPPSTPPANARWPSGGRPGEDERPTPALRALGAQVAAAQAEGLAQSGQGDAWLAEARAAALGSVATSQSLHRLGRVVSLANEDTLSFRDDLAAVRGRLLAPAVPRRRVPRVAWGLAATAAAAVLLAALWPRTPDAPLQLRANGVAAVAGHWLAAEQAQALAFSDGSSVRSQAGTRVRVSALRSKGADVELTEGRVHVHVVPQEGNDWHVHAGPYDVQVLGTRFDVAWSAKDARFELALRRGHVRIEGPVVGVRELRAGQRLTVDTRRQKVVQEPLRDPAGTAQQVSSGQRGAAAASTVAAGAGAAGAQRAAARGDHVGDDTALAAAPDAPDSDHPGQGAGNPAKGSDDPRGAAPDAPDSRRPGREAGNSAVGSDNPRFAAPDAPNVANGPQGSNAADAPAAGQATRARAGRSARAAKGAQPRGRAAKHRRPAAGGRAGAAATTARGAAAAAAARGAAAASAPSRGSHASGTPVRRVAATASAPSQGAGTPGAPKRATARPAAAAPRVPAADMPAPRTAARTRPDPSTPQRAAPAAPNGPSAPNTPAAPAAKVPQPPWALAKSGDWAGAVAAADRVGWSQLATRATAAQLLAVADAARLSGAVAKAARGYTLVRTRHPRTAPAAQAAFSLGRLRLRAGNHREAARWFERYVQERPKGALAQQARGRALECHHKVGDKQSMCAAASSYLTRHAGGAWTALAKQVRQTCAGR